jgi:hypothetical protein
MSLTSYQAAPPRVLLEIQTASVLEMRNLISEVFERRRSREGVSMLSPCAEVCASIRAFSNAGIKRVSQSPPPLALTLTRGGEGMNARRAEPSFLIQTNLCDIAKPGSKNAKEIRVDATGANPCRTKPKDREIRPKNLRKTNFRR